jgi:ABC-type transporter Mla subunit MlaD
MSDRQFGYILMGLVLCLGIGTTSYFAWVNYHPLEVRALRFPEVGSLAVEDPVRMEGTRVGEISGFEHDSLGRVVVYVRSPKPIPIRTSSRVAVKVKGVMGERFIEIGVGVPGDPLIEKGVVIDGAFEMGPSEAIAYMDMLNEKIIELKDIMLWLRDGRDGGRSFVAAFNDVVGVVDTLVWTLLGGLVDMEAGVGEGLDSIAQFVEKTGKLTSDVSKAAPEAIETVASIIEKVDAVVPKVEKVLARVSSISDSIEGNKILWGDDVEKMQKSLVEIRKYVDDLRAQGLPLTIKLKF